MINTDECWLWAGPKNEQGYGECFYNGKTLRAHRVTYESFKGEIPKGLVIDHLCRVTSCVNPDHLEAVTNRENILRGIGFAGQNHRKTHCPRGHEYTEDNVANYSNKYRRCRECENARNRGYYASNKDKWKKVYNAWRTKNA